MRFLNIMLCYYFSLEAVLQGVAKSKAGEKEMDAEIQATCPSVKTHRRENLKFIVTICKGRFKL